MDVIFLDCDGVLNSKEFICERDEEEYQHLYPSEEWWASMIDEENMEYLNTIIEETGAKVVVSSTWRLRLEPPEFQRIFERKGFIGEVIGRTTREDRQARGIQIKEWLDGHREVDSFVILDDDSDMSPLLFAHVQPSYEEGGLQKEHAKEAVEILNASSWEDLM